VGRNLLVKDSAEPARKVTNDEGKARTGTTGGFGANAAHYSDHSANETMLQKLWRVNYRNGKPGMKWTWEPPLPDGQIPKRLGWFWVHAILGLIGPSVVGDPGGARGGETS